MRIPMRDVIASGLVAAAVVLYLAWVFDATVPGLRDPRVMGLVVLVLGVAASASAVVPDVRRLLRGSRGYLGVTTLLGLAASGAGLAAVRSGSRAGLAVLVVVTVALWVLATARHLAPEDDDVPPDDVGRHGAPRSDRHPDRRSFR